MTEAKAAAAASALALLVGVAALVLVSASAGGRWEQSTEIDQFTDAKSVMAWAEAHDTNQEGYKSLPSINLRCDTGRASDRLEVWLSTGEFLNTYSDIPTRVRFDSEPTVNLTSSPSTEGKAAFLDLRQNPEFYDMIRTANHLLVEVADYRGTRYWAKFNLAGSAEAIAPLMQECESEFMEARRQADEERRNAEEQRSILLAAEKIASESTLGEILNMLKANYQPYRDYGCFKVEPESSVCTDLRDERRILLTATKIKRGRLLHP